MTIGAVSLDDNELLVRSLTNVGAIAPATPFTPSGLSSDSSIGKSAAVESTASLRPQLEPPPHFMYGLLRIHNKLEDVADKQTRLFDTQVKSDMAEIEKLEIDKAEKLRKSAEAVKSQQTWGALANVAQYVMSGTAIMLGAAVLPAAPWAGGCLILSGAVGLAGRVMHDTGAHQAIAAWFTKSNELQKTIATRIEMGMFCLSFGLGLAGGAWAHSLGALGLANKAQEIVAGVGLAASLGKGVAEVGGALHKKRSSHLEADFQNMQVRTNELYQQMYQEAREVQNLIDTTTDVGDELKRAIATSVVHSD